MHEIKDNWNPMFAKHIADPNGNIKEHYYRPQQSWAKVIFSQASVCPQGGVCLNACWDAPLRDQTPPGTRPSGADPTGPDSPRDQTPPRTRSPPGPDPPRADIPPEQTPPRKQTPAYSQRGAGTHPTGMHSCIAS